MPSEMGQYTLEAPGIFGGVSYLILRLKKYFKVHFTLLLGLHLSSALKLNFIILNKIWQS